jgi:hypothetical protein
VLDGVADALLLDAAERTHLKDLAGAARGSTAPAGSRQQESAPEVAGTVRPGLRRFVDSVSDAVVFVRDDLQNIVAINDLGRQFYSLLYVNPALSADPAGHARTDHLPNLARFQFLDPGSRVFYPQWQVMARMCVASMRMTATRTPDAGAFRMLVGELSTGSAEFRRLWAAHDVRIHGHGVKSFHHPEVGPLDLAYEEFAITGDPGLSLYVYSAEPGSASEDRLRLLMALTADRSGNVQGETTEVATR